MFLIFLLCGLGLPRKALLREPQEIRDLREGFRREQQFPAVSRCLQPQPVLSISRTALYHPIYFRLPHCTPLLKSGKPISHHFHDQASLSPQLFFPITTTRSLKTRSLTSTVDHAAHEIKFWKKVSFNPQYAVVPSLHSFRVEKWSDTATKVSVCFLAHSEVVVFMSLLYSKLLQWSLASIDSSMTFRIQANLASSW